MPPKRKTNDRFQQNPAALKVLKQLGSSGAVNHVPPESLHESCPGFSRHSLKKLSDTLNRLKGERRSQLSISGPNVLAKNTEDLNDEDCTEATLYGDGVDDVVESGEECFYAE